MPHCTSFTAKISWGFFHKSNLPVLLLRCDHRLEHLLCFGNLLHFFQRRGDVLKLHSLVGDLLGALSCSNYPLKLPVGCSNLLGLVELPILCAWLAAAQSPSCTPRSATATVDARRSGFPLNRSLSFHCRCCTWSTLLYPCFLLMTHGAACKKTTQPMIGTNIQT